MTYENEKCPICSKAFTPDDDVVVCPICGTPHHRECYIQNKNCVNESLHSQGFEWQPTTVFYEAAQGVAETAVKENVTDDGHKLIFCPRCGKENSAEEPVCKFCGERLYNNGEKGVFSQPIVLPDMSQQQFGSPIIQINPNDTIGGHTVSDTAEYIQFNANKYIPKMYKMEKTGKKASFNWAAFLFSPYWFFFRKMHVVGFVLVLILLATSGFCSTPRLIEATRSYEAVAVEYYEGTKTNEDVQVALKEIISLPESIILFSVEIGVKLFSGFFGTYLYKRKAEKDITEIKSKATSPEEYRLFLFKSGGISGGMCALACVGYYCAAELVGMLTNSLV